MAKGPPPNWNRRDCRFDHLVVAALGQGYGKILIYRGIETEDRAHEIRRGIYRCASHRGISADAGKSVRATGDEMGVHKERDGTFSLHYRLWDKRKAKASHVKRYGTDRSQWPYDPKRPATPEEKLSWANKDETGRPVIHD